MEEPHAQRKWHHVKPPRIEIAQHNLAKLNPVEQLSAPVCDDSSSGQLQEH